MADNIKHLLHQQCIAYVQKRLQEAEHAFRDAEQAANDDTKSSAGDKYETGREMMQQEKNRITAQLKKQLRGREWQPGDHQQGKVLFSHQRGKPNCK